MSVLSIGMISFACVESFKAFQGLYNK